MRRFGCIKPSGVEYDKLEPKDMVVVDLSGKQVKGTFRPSSDTSTHLVLYNKFLVLVGLSTLTLPLLRFRPKQVDRFLHLARLTQIIFTAKFLVLVSYLQKKLKIIMKERPATSLLKILKTRPLCMFQVS